MKPIWIKYKKWEDYQNNMFDKKIVKEKVYSCVKLFRSKDLENKMRETVKTYELSSKVNLSNTVFNPIAWIGQATCNYHEGATCFETRKSWGILTKDERARANKMAEKILKEWKNEN